MKFGNLHTLNLNSNRIGEHENCAGAKALGEAIQESRTLQRLFVSHNELCDDALFHLIDPIQRDAIGRNFALALFWNDFAPPGQSKAAKALHQVYLRSKVFAFHCDAVTQLVNDVIFVCEVSQGWMNEDRANR